MTDDGKRLPVRLSHKYLGIDYLGIDPPAESEDEVRLIVRVVPEKVLSFTA